jgi:hypothetical protein
LEILEKLFVAVVQEFDCFPVMPHGQVSFLGVLRSTIPVDDLEAVGQVFAVQVTGVSVVFLVEIVLPLGPVSKADLVLELFFEAAAELIN